MKRNEEENTLWREHDTNLQCSFTSGQTQGKISSLVVDGMLSDDMGLIKECIVNFYKNIYKKRNGEHIL